jgi:hypothetical protein
MDRIPNKTVDRTKEMEHRAKLQDVQQRARAAAPINAGRDILRAPSGGGTKF